MPRIGRTLVTSRLLGSQFQQVEHFGLDVDGQHTSVASRQFGELQRVVSVATPHVTDGHARFDSQIGHHQRRSLLEFSIVANEPFGSRVMHRLSDDSAHIGRRRIGIGRCTPLRMDAGAGRDEQHEQEYRNDGA